MQNSVNEDQKNRDPSQKMSVEESTAMTIQFLRAQLLSERSISRTARQRADELSKRVMQLEGQLKLVALQRKKAETATSEVLAILEDNGIGHFPEVNDLTTDYSESKVVDDSKEDASLTTSRPSNIEVKESAGLELGVPPLIGRSLSWKSCCDSPDSRENTKGIEENRRSSSFVSTCNISTSHHLQKPCCQKKQRDRSAAGGGESLLLDAHENAVASRSVDASNCITNISKILREGHRIEEEKVDAESSAQDSLEYLRKDGNDLVVLDGSERNAKGKGLENQSRLIGQFEEEENAQREWEMKFKENNCSSPDSYEHGNQSDVTEERDDIKEEASDPVDTVPSIGQGEKQVCYDREAMVKDLSSRYLHPHHDNEHLQEQPHNSSQVNQAKSTSEFSFSGREILEAKSNVKREWSENSSFRSASNESSEHQAAQYSSLLVGGSFYRGQSSRNSSQVATPHETPKGLGGVLDALQRAKLSLKHELSRVASLTEDRPAVRTTEPPASAITAERAVDIPVGSAGLFRVPTSSEYEVPAKLNYLTRFPDSDPSLARYYPGLRIGSGTDESNISSPYSDMSSANSSYRPVTDPYMLKGMGLPSSSRLMYPSYMDLMPKRNPDNEFARKYPSMGLGMGAEDHYSEYKDQMRTTNIYRR